MVDALPSPRPADEPGGPVHLTPLRELQLLEAHRRGDGDAIGELLEGYHRRVYAVCRRMVADPESARDLSQESLLKVMEGIDRFDGRSKLSTWVIRVTMNCCLSHLRKEKRRRHRSLDATDEPIDLEASLRRGGEPAAVRRIEQHEMRRTLEAALAGLDPAHRAVLVLRDLQDLDYRQIAEVLDVPTGTVKSRLFRARAALREEVEERLAGAADEPDT